MVQSAVVKLVVVGFAGGVGSGTSSEGDVCAFGGEFCRLVGLLNGVADLVGEHVRGYVDQHSR